MERYRTALALSGVHNLPPPEAGAPGHPESDSTDGKRRTGANVGLSPNRASGGEERGARSFDRTFEGGAPSPSECGSSRRPGTGASGGAASTAREETPRSSRRISSGRRSSPRKSSLPPTPTRTPQSASTARSREIDSEIAMGDTGTGRSSRGSRRHGRGDGDANGFNSFNDAGRGRPREQTGGFTLSAIGGRRRSRGGKSNAAGSQEERADRANEANPGVAETRTSSRGGDHGSCGDCYYEDDFDDFLEDEEENSPGTGGHGNKKPGLQQTPQNDVTGSPIFTVPTPCTDPERADDSGKIGAIFCPADDATRGSSNRDYQRSPNRPNEAQDSNRDVSTPPSEGGRPQAGHESPESGRKLEDGDGKTPRVEVVYRPPSGSNRNTTKGERPKSAARQGRAASLNNSTN